MAPRSHWMIDTSDKREMWTRLIGHPEESIEETRSAGERLFTWDGQSCLEIGAGCGRLLKLAASHFEIALGVDVSPSLVTYSREYLWNFWRRSSVVIGDGYYLPFADETFDYVYSFTCFQHMESIEEIRVNLREARRVLRPGGYVRIQTVEGKNGTGLHDGYVFASPDEFAVEFKSAGFPMVYAETIGPWIWANAQK